MEECRELTQLTASFKHFLCCFLHKWIWNLIWDIVISLPNAVLFWSRKQYKISIKWDGRMAKSVDGIGNGLVFGRLRDLSHGEEKPHIHPSKKVTQHKFDRLDFFYPGFVFIKLDIPGKPVHLPFEWCLNLLGLFHWGVCRMSKLGQCQKVKVAKLIGFYGKCMLCHVSCFPFVSVCKRTHCARAHSLYRNPPKQNIILNFK